MMKHTKTPWPMPSQDGLILENDGCFIASTYVDSDIRDPEECAANAAYIVRCVNAHDKLVAALKDAEMRLSGQGMLGSKDNDPVVAALDELEEK